MGEFDPYSRDCASRGFLGEIADPWVVLVLGALTRGTARYSAIAETVGGISQGSLTKTLRTLERDGLILRTVYAEVPPRVEYALTALGADLASALGGLESWVRAHTSEVLDARAVQMSS